MPALGHGQFSQKPRAVHRRKKKAREDAEWRANNLVSENFVATNGVGDQGDPDEIGVFKETKPPAAEIRPEPAEDEPQTFHCLTCLGAMEFGAPECPTCETTLSWEGVNDPADKS